MPRSRRVRTFDAVASVLCTLLTVIEVCRCVPVSQPPSAQQSLSPPMPLPLSSPLSPQPTSMPPSSSSYRLPTVTSPVSYDLRFSPNLNGTKSTFVGVTKITVLVLSSTSVITLNLDDLEVTAVTVTDFPVTNVTYHTDRERLEILVAGDLEPGHMYVVTISYHGVIRNDKTGLYLASYEENNTTKWMAVTDFQPASARKAFPCYDEPQFKAKFDISVVRQKNQTVLSNMPVQRIEVGPDDNTEVVHFETTPLMSTYLVAFYIGDFVPVKNEANITVYTQKSFSNQTEYIGASAFKHLQVMEEYTGIKYMLPKLDLLAIPDFNEGAMENWGMNTYKQRYLLLQKESKTIMKMEAIQGIQHEFAHQWFGNLVTCSCWKYLWLNEGFATYFQYFGTGMVRTEWPMEELFVLDVHQSALDYDQHLRRSISGIDNDDCKLEDFFDSITYYKAASLLRMLRYFVTENLFQLSIRDYLNAKKESVAEPNDLYVSFDRVLVDHNYTIGNELTVHEFMSNWTLQSGYPVLQITKNETTNTFSVTQSRFLMNKKKDVMVSDTSAAWHIGLTYTTESSKNFSQTSPSVWTNKTSRSTVIPAPPNSGWYLFNLQSIGLYRVNYDMDNWNALIRQLYDAHTEVHVLNRAQLIDDAFNLAKAGHLNYSVPLNLSKYLKKENESLPWYSAMNGFSYLIEKMPRSNIGYDILKVYVSELVGDMFKKLDDLVSNGNKEASVNRAWEEFSKWACRLDNVDCTTRTMEYFKKWEAGEKIPDDIKDAAFCLGVKRSNGTGTFYRMIDLYKTTTSISEKYSAEEALQCTTNMTLLSDYYKIRFNSTVRAIQSDDSSSLLSLLLSTLNKSIEFLTVNLSQVLKELLNNIGIADYIYSILFAYNIKVDGYQMWINAYSNEISQWLRENARYDP